MLLFLYFIDLKTIRPILTKVPEIFFKISKNIKDLFELR